MNIHHTLFVRFVNKFSKHDKSILSREEKILSKKKFVLKEKEEEQETDNKKERYTFATTLAPRSTYTDCKKTTLSSLKLRHSRGPCLLSCFYFRL